jgi:hypothetical protein
VLLSADAIAQKLNGFDLRAPRNRLFAELNAPAAATPKNRTDG